MARHSWTDIDPDVIGGTELADDYLDPLVAALYTTHFGAGAPAEDYAGSGLMYLEDATTEWVFRLRDATGSPLTDVEIFRYDLASQTITFPSADSDELIQAIVAAGSAADKLAYYTGVDTVSLTDLSAFARTFLDDTSASAARTTLGVAIGVDVQAYDAELAVLAGLVPAQGSFIVGGPATWQVMTGAQAVAYLPAFIGSGGGSPDLGVKGLVPAPATADNTKFLRGDGQWASPAGSGDVVGPAASVDAEVALFDSTTGKLLKRASISGLAKLTAGVLSAASAASDYMAYDATLASIAALGTAADKLAYTTGVDTWAESAITSFGRSLIDDAAASNARTTLGLVIGTDVQAFDQDLADIAALAPNYGSFIARGQTGWAAFTGAQATDLLAVFTGSGGGSPDLGTKGLVPAPATADNVKFLRGDATWAGSAAQSDQETATSLALPVTPGVQQYHPSAAKGWVKCNTTTTISASYNVSSITDLSTGSTRVNWNVDFSSGDYAVIATAIFTSNGNRFSCITGQAAGTTDVSALSNTGTLSDPDFFLCAAFGDQ